MIRAKCRSSRWSVVAASLATIPLFLAATTAAQETDGKQSGAATVFRERCASCHTVPDPALRTDRAWLAQVARTA